MRITWITLIVAGLMISWSTGRAGELPVAHGGPAVGKRDSRLSVVAQFTGAPPAGVAVSRSGRVFVSFPRWGDASQFSCAEVLGDGTLEPFPDLASHQPSAKPADRLVSVQGMDVDANDRLWLLDAATAKLRCYDLASGRMVKLVEFSAEVLKTQTYANDVRVDARRGSGGFAYISDSAGGGVIVADLGRGTSWRRLSGAKVARGADDFIGHVEGETLMYRPKGGKETPMRGNTDGIALAPDGKTLYFTAFSRRELCAVASDVLTDASLPETDVEAAVRKIADKPAANDGMTTDPHGRIYTTDYEDNSIRRWRPNSPADQKGDIVVQDERLLWPDALWVHDGQLYITTNQLNRMAGLHEGKDRRERPFAVFRLPLE